MSDQAIERPASTLFDYFRTGLYELVRGLMAWRAWSALGQNDVKRRYRRSRLGQLWFTLSMGIFIFGLATILGGLFRSRVTEILPWFAINIVFWTFMASIINESANGFVEAESFMKQVNLPHCTYLVRIIYRNLLILAHNVVIIPLILLYSWQPISWVAFLSIVGVVLMIMQLMWIAIVLSTLTARFRDIPQVIQNIVQLAFFLTPIMFKPEQMPPELWAWLKWNPFQSHLALVRQPILGEVPLALDYLYVLATMVAGYAFALTFLGRFRNRIVYWV